MLLLRNRSVLLLRYRSALLLSILSAFLLYFVVKKVRAGWVVLGIWVVTFVLVILGVVVSWLTF